MFALSPPLRGAQKRKVTVSRTKVALSCNRSTILVFWHRQRLIQSIVWPTPPSYHPLKTDLPCSAVSLRQLSYFVPSTRSIGQIIAFNSGYLSLMHSLSVISANISINCILPKTRLFVLHFYRVEYWPLSRSELPMITRLAMPRLHHINEAAKSWSDNDNTRSSVTAEIARVGGHYAVQGHSRSLIWVPIESPCATSY